MAMLTNALQNWQLFCLDWAEDQLDAAAHTDQIDCAVDLNVFMIAHLRSRVRGQSVELVCTQLEAEHTV
jgi:hypothetical protein